jgi:DNA-binding CsgD family transcriptional regulator
MPPGRDSPRHAPQTGGVDGLVPEEAERALDLLLAVHARIRTWPSFELGIERLLGDLAARTDHSAAVLWLPRGGALGLRACWAGSGVDRAGLEEQLRPVRFERGSGLAGHVWTRAEPVWAGSSQDGGTPARGTLPGQLRAGIGLPALAGAEVVGVIELYSHAPPELGGRMVSVLSTVGHELGRFFNRRRAELDLSPLTAREVEVLTLAAAGLPVAGIGERLAISRGTVKSHLEHIYSKLGVVNRTAAVASALRAGLIE